MPNISPDVLFGAAQVGLVILVLVLSQGVLNFLAASKKRGPFPPGPPGRFLIGNMLDFPAQDSGKVYEEWGKKYNSKIVHASALGSHVFVVNDLDVADELFERRANIYSNRPHISMVDILGWGWNTALLPYGQTWRDHRKVAQQNFNKNAAKAYQPIQVRKVRRMLQGLLDAPDKSAAHNKMLSVSITMEMMCGYDVEFLDDPCIHAADKSIELGARLLIPGASLINAFPVLRHIPVWLPGATTLRTAAETIYWSREMQRIPMEFVTKTVNEGTAIPSLLSNFLERKLADGATPYEEDVVKSLAYTVYGAASDTTIAATGSFLYLMALHPEVQERAQVELDELLKGQRLPEFGDRTCLPYVEAIYREVMRCQPPLHLAMPHSASKYDSYDGYFIPEGSIVFGNVWAMTHDESKYPDPFKFMPERFFNDIGELNGDNRILAYGFGRRVCVGKYVASSTMWITIASILVCFDIRKAKDEFGNEIEINGDYEDLGLIWRKKAFESSITPRSDEIKRLIEGDASL
ncbi:hypothetical protein NLJ89_g11218 [Agrocybe chaxingu]|uniref:Cytochrome P450 n=1 Tax=Agrocybe chaxingu TaxID=84603 RepID=A0A9W8MN79_9AGAR|nr:hypothetical protein NLJ89_g11218 [Agrocybe chaxingu]